jgi:MtaA/CmuA family methyltransferase
MPESMTPRERVLAALRRQPVDRTPVASPTSVATMEQMARTGAWFPRAHTDAATMARLAAAAHELLGYDAVMPVFSVVQEAAMLGAVIDWGDAETMPTVRGTLWSSPEQVRLRDSWRGHPATGAVLEAIARLRSAYGGRVAVIGKVMGPWTLSYHLHGLQPFLEATLLDPARVRGFLERLSEVTLAFGQAQLEAGADLLCLADHATGDLVRGEMYRDYLLPIHARLVRELRGPVVLHICGNTLDRLVYIADAGFAGFHFDSVVDAGAAVATVGERLALVGNVNNAQVLLRGTPEEAAAQAAYAARAGVRIVGPECAVPLRTPLANLRAIRDGARGQA